jgi:hypothetical protein
VSGSTPVTSPDTVQAVIVEAGDIFATDSSLTDLNVGTDDFAAECWLRTTRIVTDTTALVSKWQWAGAAPDYRTGYYLFVQRIDDAAGTISMLIHDGSGYSEPARGPTVIADGQWHHVFHSVDRDGNAITYVDGVPGTARDVSAFANSLDVAPELGIYAEFGDVEMIGLRIWRFPSGLPVGVPTAVAEHYAAGPGYTATILETGIIGDWFQPDDASLTDHSDYANDLVESVGTASWRSTTIADPTVTEILFTGYMTRTTASALVSPGAGTWSYSMYAVYDEYGSGTDERFSELDLSSTITVTVS